MNRVGKRSGLYGKAIDEPIPVLEKVESEKVVAKGENNSFMLMGRDRPTHPRSGYGGKGATQAGRIDLIAGMAASMPRGGGEYGPPDDEMVVNPNFAVDAARIYVSQKTDLDKYMGLAEVPGQIPAGYSGIGLKADAIRIHSRHDVKIVTGRGRYEGLGDFGERLSDGTPNERVGTISFIAGNFTDDSPRSRSFNMLKSKGGNSNAQGNLQPLIKGSNLEEALEQIIQALQQINALVGANTSNINQMTAALSGHIHTVGPLPTTPSPVYAPVGAVVQVQGGMTSASKATVNKIIDTININFLKPSGKKYIKSKYVFTT